MSSRFTWMLLALVLGTGAFLLWDAESRTIVTAVWTGTLPEPVAEEFEALVELDPNHVREIELTADAIHLRLLRTESGWSDAPSASVDYFLGNVARVGQIGSIESRDGELGDFGLVPAQRQIVLRRDGTTDALTIQIGKANPPGTAVYTRIDGRGPVLIAGSVLVWEFDRLVERVEGYRRSAAETR